MKKETASRQKTEKELLVFISNRDSRCDECKEELGRHAWITLKEDKGALCLSCADLDHLIFLPSGDAALTRRARKYSTVAAVVLKWSQARKRYERQGLLVENEALEKAEEECLADTEIRERRREREAENARFWICNTWRSSRRGSASCSPGLRPENRKPSRNMPA